MSNRDGLTYTSENSGVVAVWHGGEYIDLGHLDADGDHVALDCLNVWDHEHDRSTIPYTMDALAHHVEQHFALQFCHYCGDEADQDDHVYEGYRGALEGICTDCCATEGYTHDECDECMEMLPKGYRHAVSEDHGADCSLYPANVS